MERRDEELEQLRRELIVQRASARGLRDARDRSARYAAEQRARAEKAEAAVARARAVCHKAMAEKDAPGMWLVAQQVLAAIDNTQTAVPEEER
ncbi:hypothetical protein [Nonomuraea sp. NPDC003804]|uniref:hypothetical protein n=1 Tax=Nonomuraea sp. NPDC003804 TaxID=3154547 RepID=UPI0033B81F25